MYYNALNEPVGSSSVIADAAANVWDYKSVILQAPYDAVTAKVICYSSIASTGAMYFDGVSLRGVASVTNQCTRYVSPSGTGAGTSRETPAKYNNTNFWNGVKASLATNGVRVIFQEGDYLINNNEDCLVLSDIGNAAKPLILEGEHPYGSVFTRNDNATAELTMVKLQYAANVVVRHLHWEEDITDTSKLTSYSFTISAGKSGTQTQNITVEGCSFVGVNRNVYGAVGVHYKMTHDVEISNCEFIRGGHSGGFHMIYNAYGPYNLRFRNNYFQDCAGSYLRLRASTHEAVVIANKFVSTATAYNQPFVQLATFNDIDPGDETWGYNLSITGNSFTYMAAYAHAAVNLYHKGFDPVKASGGIWNYLLTTAEKSVLTTGSVADKTLILKNNFGLISGTNLALTIAGNERIGYQTYKVDMESQSGFSYTDSKGIYHACPNYGGNGVYNLSDVFPD